MVWGSETISMVSEKYKLYYTSGSCNKYNEMTYYVCSKNDNFKIEVTKKQLKNIEKIYIEYLREIRKNKLKKILNGLQ